MLDSSAATVDIARPHGSVIGSWSVALIVIGGVVVFPLTIANPYWLLQLTLMGVYVIVAQSFRYIVTMGEYSFAHVPLMGMGAYASAVLVTKIGMSFWLAMPIAVIIAAIAAIVIYYPCLRTSGTVFFFSSFAFGEVMRLCWLKFDNPFGGAIGLYNIPRPNSINMFGVGEIAFTSPPYISSYYLVMIITGLSLLVLYLLERSRLGGVAEALASSRTLAPFLGIRVWRYEMIILVIASAFAGLAGVLYAHYVTLIVPDDFYWGLGINVVIWAVVGGVGRFWGPVVGVVVFTLLRELLRPIPELVPLVYGLILALTLVFLPEGLISLPQKLGDIVNGLRRRSQERAS
jgi:branched-chain amino acid transport system permease protein